MNIDERLEAVAQNLELTARMQQQTEREVNSVQERVTKLEDQMIVQAELVARFERRVDQFMEGTQAWMERHDTQIAELLGVAIRVLERMDRFIQQGQERNGHGEK